MTRMLNEAMNIQDLIQVAVEENRENKRLALHEEMMNKGTLGWIHYNKKLLQKDFVIKGATIE